MVKVPVGYPSSRVDFADSGRPFPDFCQKTKIRPKVPPPKNLGLMLGFLETGEVSYGAEVKPTVRDLQ